MQQRTIILFFILFLLTAFGTVGQPVLVKDIWPGSSSGIGNINSRKAQVMGDRIFFWANDGSTGEELWVSDGTSAGTVLVKDIENGSMPSGPGEFLATYKNRLYFEAYTTLLGREIWSSDGTDAGTSIFLDACPGSCSATTYGDYPLEAGEINGTLLFRAAVNGSQPVLWATDGTSVGTKFLKSIGSPGYMTSFKGNLYISSPSFQNNFWLSDGTESGTQLIKSLPNSGPRFLTASDTILYFQNYSGASGTELYRSNGTANGTYLVKDIHPGSSSGLSNNFETEKSFINGKLLFLADDGLNGEQLWSSDGTEGGTSMVKSLSGGGNALISILGQVNNRLVFNARNTTLNIGGEPWVSDGTAAGTQLLKDIVPGFLGSDPQHGFTFGNKLFFVAINSTGQVELWQTDGTPTGTKLFQNLTLSTGITNTGDFYRAGNNLFFFASTPASGDEVWKLDFSPPVADISTVPDTVCKGKAVQFSAIPSPGSNLNYVWKFGTGASPQTATGIGPHTVSFSTVGSTSARLIVGNGIEQDTTVQMLTVSGPPTISFTFTKTNQTFTFTNTTTGFSTLLWDFGDGNTSIDTNPVHPYATAGTYTVKLTATNACGSSTSTKIVMPTVGTHDLIVGQRLSISPNPSQGIFQLKGSIEQGGEVCIRICDMQGRTLRTTKQQWPAGAFDCTLDASGLPPNVYQLILQTESGILTERISLMP